MNASSPATDLVLADWRTHHIDVRRRPLQVTCLGGEVLVTIEGDPEDHVLGAGEALRVARRGRVVVAALQPSRVRIEPCLPHREVAMTAAEPRFHVRGRGVLPGLVLVALSAALPAAFVGATWGRAAPPTAAAETLAEPGPNLTEPSPTLALCVCPEPPPTPREER